MNLFIKNWWTFAQFSREFREIGAKMKKIKKIVTSGNCLQFPEIPTKISENFNEKSAISVKFQQHFEKITKNHKHVRKSEDFEM